MTTKVTIDTNNHIIEVVFKEGESETVEILPVNSPPRDYWVYGDRVITIREKQEPAA